jgi:DNA-directed RNA polymerase specialized sigma subunit
MTDRLVKVLKDAHKDLKRAIDDVEKRKKDFLEILLIARNKEGWTYQEIADVLGISTSRVQQLVRQAQGKKRSNR